MPLHADQGSARSDLINPVKLLQTTEAVMDDNSIIIVDGGDFAATCAYINRLQSHHHLRLFIDPAN